MYELTVSEGATILSILSRVGDEQGSDPSRSGIPASTFYSIRRKVYEAGWLADRYVPHPWANGFSSIDFILARPNATERTRLEHDWTHSRHSVVVWAGLNSLLGVFFRRNEAVAPPADCVSVSVTPSGGSVPVYFDYSRLWSRFVGSDSGAGYPRSLGRGIREAESGRSLTVTELLVQDQVDSSSTSVGHRWHSLTGLTRHQRQLLDIGGIESRTMLNAEALPAYDGRTLGEIVFLSGRLRKGASAAEVLNTLNLECRVSPFLFAEDDHDLVLAALGQLDAHATRRTTIPRASRSVVEALDSSLENIRMAIERVDSTRKLVDHRYDRLFPEVSGGPMGPPPDPSG